MSWGTVWAQKIVTSHLVSAITEPNPLTLFAFTFIYLLWFDSQFPIIICLPKSALSKLNKAAYACGLHLISKVTTSIGLTSQLYRNAKMSNLNFVVQMSKDFSISSCFEPIDVITLRTPWWPQLHSTCTTNLKFIIFTL